MNSVVIDEVAPATLTMASAHVLELAQKLNYSAEMCGVVNTTLYRYFAPRWLSKAD